MKNRLSILFLVIFFVSNSSASAEESLNLEKALSSAWSHNPLIETKRKELDASRGRFVSKSALEGPEVRFEIGGFKSQEVGGEKVSPEKNLDSFEIIQPLEYPPVWFLKSGVARDDIRIAESELSSAWAETQNKVQNAFLNVLYSTAAVKVFQSTLESSQRFLDQVEVKYQSGGTSKIEKLRARIELSRAQAELLEAQNSAESDKAELNLLLGRPADSPMVLEGKLSYESGQAKKEELLILALSNRSDLKESRLRLNQLGKQAIQSRFEILPKPFVGFNRTDTDFEDDYSIILGAKLNLWDLNLGAIQETEALKAKEALHLEALEREIQNEVLFAIRELELAQKNVEIQKNTQEEANELLREITLRYEEGDMDFLLYLENMKAVKEAKLSYLKAQKNYAGKAALVELVTQKMPLQKGEKNK